MRFLVKFYSGEYGFSSGSTLVTDVDVVRFTALRRPALPELAAGRAYSCKNF